jgi:hypothetical protein
LIRRPGPVRQYHDEWRPRKVTVEQTDALVAQFEAHGAHLRLGQLELTVLRV